jgi:hypothetical protein
MIMTGESKQDAFLKLGVTLTSRVATRFSSAA